MALSARRLLVGHPRFFAAVVSAVVVYVATAHRLAPPARNALAWDVGALVFLLGATIMFARGTASTMPTNAERQAEGEWTIFWVTLGAVVFSFTTVVDALSGASHAAPAVVQLRVALVTATLLLSWLLTQVVFTTRYAHEYYQTKPDGGLQAGMQFPGEPEPDYWDFLYFSFSFGMAFQTSDVSITSRPLRRLATVHGFLGFLFNTVIISLTVNLAAALV